MDEVVGLTFRAPLVLWALAAVPFVLVFLFAKERSRRHLSSRFVSERIRGRSNGLRFLRPMALSCAIGLTCVALAGPQVGTIVQTVRGTESNLVVALDTSMSMAAEDVGTSRLAASKALVRRILAETGGRVALVVFEGTAEVVSPLTEDHSAVGTLVESIGAGETPESGSNLSAALEKSLEITSRARAGSSSIILISDGEQRGGDVAANLTTLRERGIRASTVLVGNESGASIPLEGTTMSDEDGQTIVTRADPRVLQQIASATGGHFYSNPFSSEDISTIIESIEQDSARSEEQRIVRAPRDRYQWPLGAALFFFVIGSVLQRGSE